MRKYNIEIVFANVYKMNIYKFVITNTIAVFTSTISV